MPQQCTPIQLPMLLDQKRCKGCGEVKPLSEFYRNPTMRDGRMNQCKLCRKWYAKDWYQRDPESRRASKKAWYEANREHAAEYQREWRKHNPERALSQQIVNGGRRRQRLYAAPGTLTQTIAERVFAEHGRACLACGSTDRVTLDHVVPISRGGTNLPDNLQPLCLSCNKRKHAKIIDYRVKSSQVPGD